MRVFILFGQRKCAYPGQYAPEALEIMDEYAHEDGNPEWLHEKLAEYENTGEFDGVRIIEVDLGMQIEGLRELILGVPKIKAKGILDCEHDYKPGRQFSALWDIRVCAKCGHEDAKYNEEHP